ncbi:MAG: hypothetical protein ACE3JQ_03780 [Paenisporosarcina sp.]
MKIPTNKESENEEKSHDEKIDTSRLKLSSNDISLEKNENTETVTPVNRINTEGL